MVLVGGRILVCGGDLGKCKTFWVRWAHSLGLTPSSVADMLCTRTAGRCFGWLLLGIGHFIEPGARSGMCDLATEQSVPKLCLGGRIESKPLTDDLWFRVEINCAVKRPIGVCFVVPLRLLLRRAFLRYCYCS